jgi:hypothetical protein
MAQGMLERVMREANTPAIEPSAFNAKLKAIQKDIFGIERFAFGRFIQAAEMQKRRLEMKYGPGYRPISLDALRDFRTPEGWPAIAIFSLDDPRFEISLKAEGYRPARASIFPKLPQALANCFTDVIERLRMHVPRDIDGFSHMEGRLVLAAEYRGLIPPDIKEKILAACCIFSSIFILAEPERWSLQQPALLPADPLAVGWDGKGLYLIAEFDTTPVEEAMLLEGPANKQK